MKDSIVSAPLSLALFLQTSRWMLSTTAFPNRNWEMFGLSSSWINQEAIISYKQLLI